METIETAGQAAGSTDMIARQTAPRHIAALAFAINLSLVFAASPAAASGQGNGNGNGNIGSFNGNGNSGSNNGNGNLGDGNGNNNAASNQGNGNRGDCRGNGSGDRDDQSQQNSFTMPCNGETPSWLRQYIWPQLSQDQFDRLIRGQ